MAWTFINHRLSIRHRIFGGFGLLIAVFLVAVAILLRGQAHVDQEADAVSSSSLVAEHVADFVSTAVEAQKSVLRYAVSENDADLAATRKALSEFTEGARVLEETSAGWKSGVSAVSSALEAGSKYQAASADTIQTIAVPSYGDFTIQQGNHGATHHRLGHPSGASARKRGARDRDNGHSFAGSGAGRLRRG